MSSYNYLNEKIMAQNASEIIMINFSLLPQTEIAKKIIEYGETL